MIGKISINCDKKSGDSGIEDASVSYENFLIEFMRHAIFMCLCLLKITRLLLKEVYLTQISILFNPDNLGQKIKTRELEHNKDVASI